MRVFNSRKFGAHLMLLRNKAGLKPNVVFEKLGMHPGVYRKIEAGEISEIDDDIIDALMDVLPGFSPATADGVTMPSVSKDVLDQDGSPTIDNDRYTNTKNL